MGPYWRANITLPGFRGDGWYRDRTGCRRADGPADAGSSPSEGHYPCRVLATQITDGPDRDQSLLCLLVASLPTPGRDDRRLVSTSLARLVDGPDTVLAH